ncbi:hypothetical protein [Alteraurantiacibacter aquimixticola]|uniref:4-O-methyl-glucuronoyl methylesterase-like domain-containing protein n=1 Tax=Alteraurantiacibacter aquimixticola TaxID=2489173 RepID=A0A4T3F2E9_9SPHN|nr:hypothetical protein [Alteraurantiacibacter aquimixticola]TIX50250.1 hypothetical protein E5222_08165 [Alteraurantiacibacter aquimixticola]
MDRTARRTLSALVAALACLLAAPLAAQVSNEDVHAAERARYGYGALRQGANGNDPDAPNAANTSEARVVPYTLPPLFETAQQQTPEGWPVRRAELAAMVADVWVGRIPAVVESFRIEWDKLPVEVPPGDYVQEHWTGCIIAPDGRSGPVVDALVSFPRKAREAPAVISYTYVWPGGSPPNFGGTPPPDPVAQAIARGWVHVEYHPQLLQADNAVEMEAGVIGLARWPRMEHDWGALRAWGWGASKLREELAADPRVSANRITLTGHSRFGKGVLVAAAYDHAFHDAHVSSSGAGGSKIMRRDFGERWENLTSSGLFHWFTPAAMRFAADPLTIADLPVDAHSLIALRAPRPLFITSGLAEKGDSWVDPRGMWVGMMAAQPAWELFGAATPPFAMPVPLSTEQAIYPLAWYQHGEGHVPWPAYEAFYDHAERFFTD